MSHKCKAKRPRDPYQAVDALRRANPNFYLPRLIRIEEARYEAKEWVDNIFAQHEKLNFLLNHFGDLVRKRWLKKTPAQREKVVAAAWAVQMPEYHRPDINACLEYPLGELPRSCKDFFVFPHMNLDDLSKPRPLLVMMESRAKYSPDAFAAFDRDSLEIGIATGTLVHPVLSGWTMNLLGRKTAKTYGQLRSWKDDNDFQELLNEGIGIQPGEGITILLIQSKLFDFLINCVRMIIPDNTVDQSNGPVKTASPSMGVLDQEPSSPLDALLETPYRVPASIESIDFRRLQALLYAKHAEVADHLWYLRQDPGYFHNALSDFSQHQIEQLPDTKGRSHARLNTPSFWRRMVGNLITDAYGAPFQWTLTARRLAEASRLYDMHKDRMLPGKRLPRDFEVSVCKLSYQLWRGLHFCTICLQMGLQASPPLRKYYLRNAADDLDHPHMELVKSYKQEIMLRWLLEQLKDEKSMRFYGLHNLLSYVHRIMLSQPQGRTLVSGWVAKILSDMALLNEIERQISLIRLKNPGKPAVSDTALQMDYAEATLPMEKVFQALETHDDEFEYDSPLEIFKYPCEQERTEATTWGMRTAEKHLDALWEKLDQFVREKTGKGFFRTVAPTIADRIVNRTPEWGVSEDQKELLVASKALQLAVERLNLAKDDLSAAISTILPATPPKAASKTSETPEAPSASQVPQKPATTQSSQATEAPHTSQAIQPPNVPQATQAPQPPAASTSKPPPKQILHPIPVGKKAYKTFMTLFPSPNDKDNNNDATPPPDLPWSDFLNAMVNIGFTTEKLTGSAWVFSLKEDIESENVNAIIFHEPHPKYEIPWMLARRMGERLEWEFGWTREAFVRGG